MNTLRQVCAVTILSLTLAGSVLAGQIETPGAPAPAPASTTSSITTTVVLAVVSLIYG